MDIVLLSNRKKKINFELNCFYHYNKIVNRYRYSQLDKMFSIQSLQLLLNEQSEKNHFTFKILHKRFENKWIYLLKYLALIPIFGFGFVFCLPSILFIRDTHYFTIECI